MNRAKTAGIADALARYGVNRAAVRPLMEVAGLGALAIPVAHHLATADNNTDRAMSGIELGGLGILAAPEIMHLLGRH
jgi:hypothetical protein